MFMILPEIKNTSYTQIIKTPCEKMADHIKALRYFTSENNNNPQEYEMDRRKTEEQLKKFELNKCDNNLLIDNSWNPLTDGTIKK